MGSLCGSMRTAVASLIYKKGSHKDLANYRTISLTNTDYKIIANALKARLIPVLPHLVGPWQTCGINGRSIYDNLSFLRDAFQSGEMEGALFSLDQEAAFDRVNFQYLFSILKNFNFPDKFIRYIKLIHFDFSLTVAVGSSLTLKLPLEIGLKQGDPIASVLYVLVIEPFLFNLNKRLVNLGPSAWPRYPQRYLSAYADDTNVLVSNASQISLVESEFQTYAAFSASKLNETKSEILLLGNSQISSNSFPVRLDGLKILGILFGDSNFMNMNFCILLDKFREKLTFYDTKSCAVSFFSRAKILNTYLLPVLWYFLKVLDPPEAFINTITFLCERFVWKAQKHWVGRQLLYLPLENGGLGVRHPRVQTATFRVTFIQKMLKCDNAYFCDLSSQNVFNILTKNCFLANTCFYQNLTVLVKTLLLHFNILPILTLNMISINNTTFFKRKYFNYLTKTGIDTVQDFTRTDCKELCATAHASARRHIESEFNTLKGIIDSIKISDEVLTLQCLAFNGTDAYEGVTKATVYLLCTRCVKNIKFDSVPPEIVFDPCWGRLKEAEISNPEKDVVFKLFHKKGLTPKIATAMGLHQGRDCPFCHAKEISTSHYPFCDIFKPLWAYIFKILKLDNPTPSLKSYVKGCGDKVVNIFIFYGLCTVYKTFIFSLNHINDGFDLLSHYRHLVFGRLLAEYQVCTRSGRAHMANFVKKYEKFKLFKIINDRFDINI